ncbi:hypothetical protein Pan44_50020 [Caulifigura coniformis]|uniref:Lipid/polyisoprenoid-binding YceI-like domain-containing protein n=1 Tax=Caulifigura coniformis TaxID=2527983 RepID=A0A517SLD1_9PLAN|nr:hypothetical protein [Caulifigura coniformis]QDT56939.1 hypothetical protein Pan44_50020 [Caulifigura coniformis]
MSLKKLALGLCCLAVISAGVAEAKKLVIKNFPYDGFIGIDEEGELADDGYSGLVKISLNLKNGKLAISGKAVVDNEFGKKVKFVDLNLLGIDELVKETYTVAKNGKATYKGRFVVDTEEFDAAAL